LTTQIEWEHLPRLIALTAGACGFAVELARGLVVDTKRMRANLEATHGVVLAEAAAAALRPHVGLDDAKALVREACQAAISDHRHLIDVLRTKTTAPIDWDKLRDDANCLGSTNTFIDAVLADAAAITKATQASSR
jgi:3-carboxy-cis,cis-muconate cycloisomerase